MRSRSCLVSFIFNRRKSYFPEFFEVLVFDHGEFLYLFLLDVNLVEVFFLIELEDLDTVLDGFDVLFGFE
jgi:hypothetical protein